MTQKELQKTKSATLYHIIILLTVLASISTCIYLQRKSGLESGSTFKSRQPDLEIKQEIQKEWAQALELPGVPNLHKVSDDLYRGAQPSSDGMKQLEKLGIKTIINLRLVHSDRDEIENTELSYVHIPMATWNTQDEDVVRFLKIIMDSNNTPVFVHCQYGADRTGTMCAIYRIAIEGWNKIEAIDEMTKGGFGFHSIWKNLVDDIHSLDIDKIKHASSLSEY
ncbi:MAG: dual specificity protein phosphatase family protein [Sedimentisphaerales bacterium]|nr:dual specificity protein phosphatase family protein [Sedimentisphaerales bacterium]